MRTLFWFIGLFALAVVLVIAARYNEGYALLVLPPWRLQVSLNLLLPALAAAFALLYFTLRLFFRTLALPAKVNAFRLHRSRSSGAQALRAAGRLYMEGRFGQAYRHAEAAYDKSEAPGLAALIAARSAHALREYERRQQWIDKAAQHDREIRAARLMIEAEFAIADRRFDEAVAGLNVLRQGGGRHIAALRLALQAEQGRGRWDEVARLARQLRNHHGLTQEQSAPLLRRATLEQLREAEGDLPALRRVWERITAAEKLDVGLLTRALPYFIGAGDDEVAPAAIEAALNLEWEPELAALYGRCKARDLRAQLATAETWLKQHPDDAGLLLTLGRLCLRGQLWGKAQSYFEASLSQASSRVAHLELARLADSLERPEEAARHYRAAAELGA